MLWTTVGLSASSQEQEREMAVTRFMAGVCAAVQQIDSLHPLQFRAQPFKPDRLRPPMGVPP